MNRPAEIAASIWLALTLAGCAGPSAHPHGPQTPRTDLARLPCDPYWSWSVADPRFPGARFPAGGHGVFLDADTLLTCRHVAPMHELALADGNASIVGVEAIGGAFGGAGSDWILLQISPPTERVFPAVRDRSPAPGERGVIVYHPLADPALPLAETERRTAAFTVIETPDWAAGGASPGLAVRFDNERAVKPGLSGAPAYILNRRTDTWELAGLLVGRQRGESPLGNRHVTKLVPIVRTMLE